MLAGSDIHFRRIVEIAAWLILFLPLSQGGRAEDPPRPESESRQPVLWEDRVTSLALRIGCSNEYAYSLRENLALLMPNTQKRAPVTDEQWKAFEESFRSYCAGGALRGQPGVQEADEITLCLALFIEKAIDRNQRPYDAELNQYDNLILQIMDLIAKDIESNPLISGSPARIERIKGEMVMFRLALFNRIVAYQKDFLCPGFRKPMSDENATAFLVRFERTYLPSGPMAEGTSAKYFATEKRFDVWLRSYWAIAANQFMFTIFVTTMDVDVIRHPQLGLLQFFANNIGENVLKSNHSWPAAMSISIVPDSHRSDAADSRMAKN
jgi:hypothetical protein